MRLIGGLGNQMFQYALGKHLSIIYQTKLLVDISSFSQLANKDPFFVKRQYDLNIFEANVNTLPLTNFKGLPYYKDSLFHKLKHKVKDKLNLYKFLNGYNIINEKYQFQYDSDVLKCGSNAYLSGYWQNEKYFKPIEEELKKDFTILIPHSSEVQKLAITIQEETSVCIHIRRTDFVRNPSHDILSADYFYRAVNIIQKKVSQDFTLFIFSDDIEWCIQNLRLKGNHLFINHELYNSNFASDFYLMTKCKHFIIPNSSFGWWAAWLGNYPEKIIIAPKRWINISGLNTSDLIPKNWITI